MVIHIRLEVKHGNFGLSYGDDRVIRLNTVLVLL